VTFSSIFVVIKKFDYDEIYISVKQTLHSITKFLSIFFLVYKFPKFNNTFKKPCIKCQLKYNNKSYCITIRVIRR